MAGTPQRDEAPQSRSGGQVLVDQLLVNGADVAFCVPGESYLPVLAALRDVAAQLRLITCRHEAAAAHMAEAYGKLTGRPGLCLVTRGPGAMQAAVGLHTASQDSTPMILLVGQVPRRYLEREAFQELDYRRVFGSMVKWVAEVDDARRIPELVGRAYTVALSGRPGPVVLALPEDVLWGEVAVPDPGPAGAAAQHPGQGEMARLRELLAAAERPLALVGGGGWSQQAKRDMESFVTASDVPVATAFRCQDYVDNDLDQYVGTVGLALDPNLAERVRACDLLLAVGERLGEPTTSGYTLLDPQRPRQRLVHAYPDPAELGRVYQPTLAIAATSAAFAAAVRRLEPLGSDRWRSWRADARADYLANLECSPTGCEVDLAAVLAFLHERLPEDAILTNGAGNYTAWVHRYTQYRHYRTQLAPVSGAMGYGVPAAISAKVLHPDRTVVAFAGDGCFLMSGQELATAVHYDLPIVVIVVNNSSYGTIQMHQEKAFGGSFGVELSNPNFGAYARTFGAHGEVVTATAEFPEAFERAMASGRPAVIELRVDPEQTLPHATLDDIRHGRPDPRARP